MNRTPAVTPGLRLIALFTAALTAPAALGQVGGRAAAPAAIAQEGGGVEIPPFEEGKLEALASDLKTLSLESRGTYAISEAGARAIGGKAKSGLVRVGNHVRIFLDRRTGSVDDVETIEAAAVVRDPAADRRLADLFKIASSLKQGDRVILDDGKSGPRAVTFDRLMTGQIWYQYPGANVLTVVRLRDVRDLKRIEAAVEPPDGGDPGSGSKDNIRPGYWYKIDGAFGYCLSNKDGSVTLELYNSGGKTQTFIIASIKSFSAEPDPRIGGGGTLVGPGAGTGAVIDESRRPRVTVEAFDPQKNLDWTDNRWTVSGTVKHAIPNTLLIGARVAIAVRGEGTMVPPAREAEVLRAMARELEGRSSLAFTFDEVQHYYERDGERAIMGETSQSTEPLSVAIVQALFPDLPETFSITTRLLAPQVESARVDFDRARALIPLSDERAIPYLIQAYGAGDEAHRAAALRAMAGTQSAKIIPFLMYELYNEQGEKGEPLKRTIASIREPAERWLIAFLRDRGFEKEFLVPNTQGGMDKKKAVADPDRMLARALELVDLVGGDSAFSQVLPHVRSPDRVVADAARAVFTRRGVEAVPWLIRRLRGESLLAARFTLREIEAHDPGTLGRTMRDHLKLGEASAKLEGLPEEEAAEKRIDLIVDAVQRGDASAFNVDADVYVVRESLLRLAAQEAQVSGLRRDLASTYASEAVRAGAGERHAKARLLRRALSLDPQNREARGLLARHYLEVAREMRQGAFLRDGPGDDYRPLRALRRPEALTLDAGADGSADAGGAWVRGRGADGKTGWVHHTLIERGRTNKLVVMRDRRSSEDVIAYFNLCRTLDPDLGAEIDTSMAELAASAADEAAAGGDWYTALARYQEANGLAPGRYKLKVLNAYCRSNPLAPAVGGVALLVFLGVLFAGGSRNGKAAPDPASASPASSSSSSSRSGRSKAPKPETDAPASKKVPS